MRHATRPDAAVPGFRPGTAARHKLDGHWQATEPRNGVPGLIPYHYRKGEQERHQWVLEQVRKAQEIAGERQAVTGETESLWDFIGEISSTQEASVNSGTTFTGA